MIRTLNFHRAALVLLLTMTISLAASEQTSPYPLWNSSESVADYAKRANLPAGNSLDLGNGVTLELELVPAGKFMMGSQPGSSSLLGEVMAFLSAGMLIIVVFIGIKKRNAKNAIVRMAVAFLFFLALGTWEARSGIKPESSKYQAINCRSTK